MEQALNALEAAVSAAGLCIVYNADDWQLLTDANITPHPVIDTGYPLYH